MRGRWIATGLTMAAAVLGTSGQATAQTAGPHTDNTVQATLQSGGFTYFGGRFTALLSPATNTLLATSPSGAGDLTGAALPKVEGTVATSVEDGAGGLFVGGEFTKVGAYARRNLVHIKADGTVDAVWNPSPDAPVRLLDRINNRLAVAGGFGAIGGRSFVGTASNGGLAVLDVATGRATSFTPALHDYLPDRGDLVRVESMDATGDRVYVAGLNTAGGETLKAAALNLETGAVLPWRAQLGAAQDSLPDSIKAVGSTVVLGLYRNGSLGPPIGHTLLGLDAASGASRWSDDAYMVYPLLIKGSGRLYVVPNRSRVPTFALDPATGKRVWTAKVFSRANDYDGQATAGLISGTTLHLTGFWQSFGGQPRQSTAAISLTTGELLPWRPPLGYNGGTAIGTLGGRIVLGGAFTAAGPLRGLVNDLGRLRADGSLDPTFPKITLTPQPGFLGTTEQWVDTLALNGSILSFTGRFTSVNGQRRFDAAAIDVNTGKLVPTADDAIQAKLDAAVKTLDAALGTTPPKPITLTAPAAGYLSYEVRLPDGYPDSYLVAESGATAAAAGDAVTLTPELNAVGSFIRSYYPAYRFRTALVFSPAGSDIPFRAEGASPAAP